MFASWSVATRFGIATIAVLGTDTVGGEGTITTAAVTVTATMIVDRAAAQAVRVGGVVDVGLF